MRWLRKRRPAPQDPEPPEGIILRARGRDIRCIPLRDPDQDEPGCAADPPDGYLPDNCVILPGFTIPGAGVEAWPGPR